MAGQGDMNLARALQAEFGQAKPPRPRRRRAGGGGGGGHGHVQAPQQFPYQYQQPPQLNQLAENAFIQRRSRLRARDEPPRPPWQGRLVTNDSPGYVISISAVLPTPFPVYAQTVY